MNKFIVISIIMIGSLTIPSASVAKDNAKLPHRSQEPIQSVLMETNEDVEGGGERMTSVFVPAGVRLGVIVENAEHEGDIICAMVDAVQRTIILMDYETSGGCVFAMPPAGRDRTVVIDFFNQDASIKEHFYKIKFINEGF